MTKVPPYKLVELEQGTDAWLDWRQTGIGASDAPTIMDENPWKTRAKLLLEKVSPEKHRIEPTPAMLTGTQLEPEARRDYERETGIEVAPACLQSTQHEWMLASVDGIAPDGSSVIEIKCGLSAYKKAAATRQVPPYYVGQVQHIMAVTGLDQLDFWGWWPQHPSIHFPVPRDDAYIESLIQAEQRFWKTLGESKAAVQRNGEHNG